MGGRKSEGLAKRIEDAKSLSAGETRIENGLCDLCIFDDDAHEERSGLVRVNTLTHAIGHRSAEPQASDRTPSVVKLRGNKKFRSFTFFPSL